jgi:hypothetical protein
LKEAREARLWLRVIVACNLTQNAQEARRLYQESNELVGIFIASVRKLRLAQTWTKTVVLVVFWFVFLTFHFSLFTLHF